MVRVGLRGCQFVNAPPAPSGRLADDPTLLPRLNALLNGRGSVKLTYPFDARNLRPTDVRMLAKAPSRILSTDQDGLTTRVLYLSHHDLLLAPGDGGPPHLVARSITDASFDYHINRILARPVTSPDTRRLLLIDLQTGATTSTDLPKGARLLGRTAGAGPQGLSDAQTCFRQYVWSIAGRHLHGLDPDEPTADRLRTADFLPPPAPGELTAISCAGTYLAVFLPGHGLLIHEVGDAQLGGGTVLRRLPVTNVSFLSWAPDDEHLAYRSGGAVRLLDVRTGAVTPLLTVGHDRIYGAAWDPWARVIAISHAPAAAPATAARVTLVNASGTAARRLPLPFTGATRLDWSPIRGGILGITRRMSAGTEAWVVSFPALPADPGAGLNQIIM